MPEAPARGTPSPGSALAVPAFGVYVHWPFCKAKCPYCDFNSHVRHEAPDQGAWADALARELAHFAELAPGRTVESVFFGGGTPSLMEPETVARVLEAVGRLWTCAPDTEVTLEANPTSVEAGRFAGYRAAGVNRVSMGVQSLDDRALAFLGRTHTADEARAAFDIARKQFDRVSFDLIYARPGQETAAWQAELAAALDMAIDHLSLYQLTIEPGTRFADLHRMGRLAVPDDDRARELYDVTRETCAQAGLPAYEISNHARPGAECRHNLVYWAYGEYAGVGPGAHARIDRDGARHAIVAERSPEAWLDRVARTGSGTVAQETLSAREQADECLLMGLRLRDGVDLVRYEALAGHMPDAGRVAALEDAGLVERLGNTRLRATPEGWPVLNAIVAELASDPA